MEDPSLVGTGASEPARSPFPEPLDDGPYPEKFQRQGLTFDDVLLVPAESAALPAEVDTRTRLTPSIQLAIPIVSAAMDTVTESRLAIALARHGGLGIATSRSPIRSLRWTR
jgi:IMP dehydrogenase